MAWKLCERAIGVLAVAGLCSCSAALSRGPEPLSIEFGQDAYLTDAYLAATPGAQCGHPVFAPGGAEARAPLPDGTWYRIVAVGGTTDEPTTVVLERGVGSDEARLTMRLDGEEGIVRLRDGERRDAWGMYHPWADWMRDLGRRVQVLDCAAAEQDRS